MFMRERFSPLAPFREALGREFLFPTFLVRFSFADGVAVLPTFFLPVGLFIFFCFLFCFVLYLLLFFYSFVGFCLLVILWFNFFVETCAIGDVGSCFGFSQCLSHFTFLLVVLVVS
jgi:hypothetical protein